MAQLYGRLIQLVVLQAAAASLTFCFWSSTGWLIWLLMTKQVIPWAHSRRLAFFHKAAEDQAPPPPTNASEEDVPPEVHARTLTLVCVTAPLLT